MKNFAVTGQRDGPGFVDGGADFFTANLTRAGSEADAAVAVHPANMRTRNPYRCMFDRGAGGIFRLLHRFLDGSHRLIEIDDDSLA